MSNTRTLKLPTTKRREFLNKATARYTANLPEVEQYLQGRCIEAGTAERWQLGFVKPGDAMPGHEEYEGRLSIPYLTPAGPLTMKFRCIENHNCKTAGCVKYLGEPGELPRLFGVWNFRHDTPVLALTEGELDAVVATQSGVRAVGVPGATQWQSYWDHLFEGYDEVILLRDGDQAGKAMSENLATRLSNLRVVKMPEGQDVTSFVAEHGGDALKERIKV